MLMHARAHYILLVVDLTIALLNHGKIENFKFFQIFQRPHLTSFKTIYIFKIHDDKLRQNNLEELNNLFKLMNSTR